MRQNSARAAIYGGAPVASLADRMAAFHRDNPDDPDVLAYKSMMETVGARPEHRDVDEALDWRESQLGMFSGGRARRETHDVTSRRGENWTSAGLREANEYITERITNRNKGFVPTFALTRATKVASSETMAPSKRDEQRAQHDEFNFRTKPVDPDEAKDGIRWHMRNSRLTPATTYRIGALPQGSLVSKATMRRMRKSDVQDRIHGVVNPRGVALRTKGSLTFASDLEVKGGKAVALDPRRVGSAHNRGGETARVTSRVGDAEIGHAKAHPRDPRRATVPHGRSGFLARGTGFVDDSTVSGGAVVATDPRWGNVHGPRAEAPSSRFHVPDGSIRGTVEAPSRWSDALPTRNAKNHAARFGQPSDDTVLREGVVETREAIPIYMPVRGEPSMQNPEVNPERRSNPKPKKGIAALFGSIAKVFKQGRADPEGYDARRGAKPHSTNVAAIRQGIAGPARRHKADLSAREAEDRRHRTYNGGSRVPGGTDARAGEEGVPDGPKEWRVGTDRMAHGIVNNPLRSRADGPEQSARASAREAGRGIRRNANRSGKQRTETKEGAIASTGRRTVDTKAKGRGKTKKSASGDGEVRDKWEGRDASAKRVIAPWAKTTAALLADASDEEDM